MDKSVPEQGITRQSQKISGFESGPWDEILHLIYQSVGFPLISINLPSLSLDCTGSMISNAGMYNKRAVVQSGGN